MSGERTVGADDRQNRRVAASVALIAVAMLGMAYAAVPLYRMFCQVTGYGGTTQRAEQAPATVLARQMRIRFDANVGNGLAWDFQPAQRLVDVRIGENTLIFYRARNTSDKPLVGTATFNVTPEVAGAYFSKLECFCFKEQRLEAGEEVEMPVSFFVDPAIVNDPDAGKLTNITLSYTFYPAAEAETAARPAGSDRSNRVGG